MRPDPRAGRRNPRHRRATASRGHWFLVGLFLLVFALGLLVEGYTHGVLGENSSGVATAQAGGPGAPGLVLHGGPVINTAGARPLTYRTARRTVALTFDDGPDPVWTPRILAILRRYHVPATFFVVGAHAAGYPGLVRQELDDGEEIGSHTYTHLDLAGGWQEQLQLTLTQNALAGTAGVHTGLLRPPYSSNPGAVTAAQWHAYRQAGADGYLIVLANLDTRDWARPGVAKIVAAAMPAASQGAIIMMHDSGGNRSETVRALPQIITRLKARGYRFTTVTGGLGLPDADVPASTAQRVAGLALVITQQAADHAVTVLAIMLVAATVLTVLRAVLLVAFARAHRRRLARPGRPMPSWRYPPGVSVVIPAYNEEAGIAATVTSMLATEYRGDFEVIVVDDGSTDATAEIVAHLGLPGVRLVRQGNGGKPAALNHGIAVARHDILVLVDGDTVFQPDTLPRLVNRLADPVIGAVSGNTKVGNRTGILGRWQHLEYVMGFNLDRRMYDMIRAMPTVPGAVGAFRRGALAAAGWLSGDTLAEDTDLTMAICRTGWEVTYEETAIAWTEAPASLRQLWRQRYRWCYGTMQSMWKHRRAMVEHGASGRLGRRCLTYLGLFHVLLPLFAPMVDVALIYSLVFLNPLRAVEFWVGFACLQALICAYALRLDRERLTPLWALPLQQVVYRQLLYLVTVQSLITALLGSHQRWQPIRRAGTFAGNAPGGNSAGHPATTEITTARLPGTVQVPTPPRCLPAVRRGQPGRLARAVRRGQPGRLARAVRRGQPGRLAGAVRRGQPGRLVWAVRRGSRLRPGRWRRPEVRSRHAVRGHVTRAVRSRRQHGEGHRLLLAGTVCFGVRPGGAQAAGTVAGRGRDDPGWLGGVPGAWGRRSDDVVGEPLQASWQRSGVGGGCEAAEAKDGDGRRGGVDWQGPEPRRRLPCTRLGYRIRAAELVPERGQRLGLAVEFADDGLACQVGQGPRQRLQLWRRVSRHFRADEQGCQRGLLNRWRVFAAQPQEVRRITVWNVRAVHSITLIWARISAIRRRPR